MKKPSCLVLVACLFVTGCGLNKRVSTTMASWMGHHQSELIRSWGPPDKTDSDGKDGQVLTWILERSGSKTSTTTRVKGIDGKYRNVTVYKDNSRQATRMFWVNGEGVIYSWRWKGR